MNLLVALVTAFFKWLSQYDKPAVTSGTSPAEPPTVVAPQLESLDTRYHISLYLKDGTALSRSRSDDEYCIRTDGFVYVKEKGKWVKMPEVVGLSFYRKSV